MPTWCNAVGTLVFLTAGKGTIGGGVGTEEVWRGTEVGSVEGGGVLASASRRWGGA
jgi:hypothetical protein